MSVAPKKYLKWSKTTILASLFFVLIMFPSLARADNDGIFNLSAKRLSLAAVHVATTGSNLFGDFWCAAKSVFGFGESCEVVQPESQGGMIVNNPTPTNSPAPPPALPSEKRPAPLSQIIQQPGPTYITNEYITKPTTIIREVVREFVSGDTSDFVRRALFDAQTSATHGSLESVTDGLQANLAASIDTGLLTVSGNTTLASLSVSGAITVTGQTTLGNASTTNLTVSTNSYLGTVLGGTWNASTIGVPYGGTGATSLTGLVIGNGASAMTATTTSAGLASIISDETGTGSAVFSISPTFTGVAAFADLTATNATTTTLTTTNFNCTDCLNETEIEDIYVLNAGDSMTGNLTMSGTSANVILGSNYLSGDGGDEGIFVDSSGNVGIGTTTPSEALTIVGGISSAGEGVANEVYGLGATLISGPGNGNTLVGAYTEMAAAGFGQYNTIVGAYSSSSNAYNTIIGSRSSATGGTSVLIGESLSSSVTYSTVIGANSSVTGAGLLAMGYSAQASHNNAVAIGWGVASAEDYEYVFGSRAVASTSPSIRLAGSTNQYTGQDLFELDTEWIDSTDATRKSRATLSVYDTAQRTFMQADATGSGVTTSFNGGSVGIGTTTPLSRLAIQTTGTTDILNLYETGGSKVLTVLESGFVGIGASTPNHMVHIKNNSSTYAGLDLEGGQAGDAQWVLFSGYPSAGDFSIRESGVQTSLTIKKTSGNVGIGTTTPVAKLGVFSNDNAGSTPYSGQLALEGSANNIGINIVNTASSRNWGIYSSGGSAAVPNSFRIYDHTGGDRVVINSSGNVGIGTSTPSYPLDIQNASSFLRLSNTTQPSTYNVTMGVAASGPNAFQLNLGSTQLMGSDWTGNNLFLQPASGGRVGIGTTTPATKLSIAPATAYATPTLGTASGGFSLLGDNALYGLYAGVSSSGSSWLQAMRNDATATAYDILLNPSGGRVGIGNTTPSRMLTVGDGGQSGVQSGVSDGIYVNPNGDGAQVAIETNSGVEGGMLALDSTGLVYMGSWSNNDLYLRSNNTTYMTITTAGNVGIGTTTPSRKLTVVGTVEFRSLTAAVGAGSLCLSSSNEVVYNSGSDNCLSSTRDTKHAITPLTLDAINILNELEPVSFIYNGTDRVRYGFIAENTASVDDILATYNAAGDLTGIDDRSILSVLVRAFQEFYKQVMDRFTAQDSRIDALEERVRELESREGIESAGTNNSSQEENVDTLPATESEVADEEVNDSDTAPVEEPEVQKTEQVTDEESAAPVSDETEDESTIEAEVESSPAPSDETLGL